MDLNQLTSDLQNMSQAEREVMLHGLATALMRAGVLPAENASAAGGVGEVMSYLTRQPVPLRGLRLLGVHAVECVQIKHPTKGIIVEIPKADYKEEEHGPIVKSRKVAAAVVAAPPADEEEDEDDDVSDGTDADDDDDDEEGDDKSTSLKPRKRAGKKK